MNQQQFLQYMLDFYGKFGVYSELDFTVEEIVGGLNQYLRTDPEFCGDSLDRERVRDIILKNRK
jgi:hypothetical protein